MSLYKLLILSPCFYPTAAPAELMVKSAKAHGLNVHLYGIGQPFIPHGADAQVFQLCNLMKQGKLADTVLVTDCRDVLFLADEGEITSKARDQKLIMSAERGCWPPDQEIAEYFYGKTPHGFDYVNAGQFIGPWDYVVLCLEHLLAKYRGKDGADNSQGWWMWAKMRGELSFSLDYNCEIFQSLSQGADQQITVGASLRPHNSVTNTFPCSLHFNGNPGNDAPQQEMYRRLFG